MQQRYYDPLCGCFLSTDPVTALKGPFNRYWYANNSPYRFADPDGRNGVEALGGLAVESWKAINGQGFDGDMVLGALIDGYNGEGSGAAMAAFEDATTFVPGGTLAKIGKFGGVLRNSARALGASSGDISAGGKAIVSMLRKSDGFSGSTIGRSVANMDVALSADAAKGVLADAGFKAGTVSGGKQSFTSGSVRFTFSVSKGGISTVYVAVKGEEVLKIRLKEPLE